LVDLWTTLIPLLQQQAFQVARAAKKSGDLSREFSNLCRVRSIWRARKCRARFGASDRAVFAEIAFKSLLPKTHFFQEERAVAAPALDAG
jgi:hypothetical protein